MSISSSRNSILRSTRFPFGFTALRSVPYRCYTVLQRCTKLDRRIEFSWAPTQSSCFTVSLPICLSPTSRSFGIYVAHANLWRTITTITFVKLKPDCVDEIRRVMKQRASTVDLIPEVSFVYAGHQVLSEQ